MPSKDACIDFIVSAFVANRYEPLGLDTDTLVPALLRPLIGALDADCAIGHHGFPWVPATWKGHFRARWDDADPRLRKVLDAIDAVEKSAGTQIERGHLHGLADQDVLQLVIAIMAWGWGPDARGWRQGWLHAERVLTANGGKSMGLTRARAKLDGLRRLARASDPTIMASSWIDVHHSAHVAWLGAAFASKFAYAAVPPERTWRTPLIADERVAWGLWMLTGLWDVRTSAELYRRYLESASRWANRCACRPDEVERALFALGPKVKSAWKSRPRTRI